MVHYNLLDALYEGLWYVQSPALVVQLRLHRLDGPHPHRLQLLHVYVDGVDSRRLGDHDGRHVRARLVLQPVAPGRVRVRAVERRTDRLDDVAGAHPAVVALAGGRLAVLVPVEYEHLGRVRLGDGLADSVDDERGADGGVQRPHAVCDYVCAHQLRDHLGVGLRENLGD
eukprot:scaffold19978_cov32-Prasinocladus_malaysianus.AAC.1